MKYKILSERVGTVGAAFDPPPGCNVSALIKGGHIEAVHERAPKKKRDT
jgi:hypothetical protein